MGHLLDPETGWCSGLPVLQSLTRTASLPAPCNDGLSADRGKGGELAYRRLPWLMVEPENRNQWAYQQRFGERRLRLHPPAVVQHGTPQAAGSTPERCCKIPSPPNLSWPMILDPFKEASPAAKVAASPRLITVAALCWTICTMLATPNVAAQTASTEQYPPEETTETSATSAPDGEAAPAKPWLITPTLAADPKLGANIGGVVAYLRKLDEQSTASMVGASVSYSDTDSITGGVGAQLFWGADTRRLMLLAGAAEINNEYDDFLGTGQKAEKPKIVCTPLGFGISSN